MLRYAGHWALTGFGYWLIEEKTSGRFVGEAGFAYFKPALTPALENQREHGWALAPWARGKGYAAEALNAQLDWAKANFEVEAVVCVIAAENARSIQLAERVGYSAFDRANDRGVEKILYRRPL